MQLVDIQCIIEQWSKNYVNGFEKINHTKGWA